MRKTLSRVAAAGIGVAIAMPALADTGVLMGPQQDTLHNCAVLFLADTIKGTVTPYSWVLSDPNGMDQLNFVSANAGQFAGLSKNSKALPCAGFTRPYTFYNLSVPPQEGQ